MRYLIVVLAACLCLALLLRGDISEFGQSFDSPDGEFTASATQYYSAEPPEMRYRITDKLTGEVVWKHDEPTHGSSDPPYGAGLGNLELIQWSADSAEVRFAIRSTNTVNVTAWIAARTNRTGGFTAGVKKKAGLRITDRTKRLPVTP